MKELTVQEIIQREDALGEAIRGWLKVNKKALLRQLASLNMHQKANLAKNRSRLEKELKTRTKKREGFYEWLAFSFPRHGIFLERGVGRGRPVGSAKAKKNAKPWLAPVLEPAYEELAGILEKEYADIVMGFILFQIPGVINFTTEETNNNNTL